MRIGFLIGALALAAALIAAVQFWPAEPEVVEIEVEPLAAPPPTPETKAAPVPSPDAGSAGVIEPELPPLPPLDDSDAFLRERLAVYAIPATWLERDDLLRRLAVVLDNAARGEYPRRQLGFLAPKGPFKVVARGEALYVDPSNHARFDGYLDVLERMAPEELGALITRLTPLLDQALAELGNAQRVTDLVGTTIDEVLSVPIRRGDIELLQPKVFYEYAEPRLEGLSPLQKQVLRMGPDNTERLQRYLVALRAVLLGTG